MSSQQTEANDDRSQLGSTSLTADAIRRVGRDIKDILKEPHENIVYIHSTTKVNVGFAMVVGTAILLTSAFLCSIVLNFRKTIPTRHLK